MVKKISEEEKKSLIERTIAVLPNNPSAAGYSADVIKRAMYQVIAGINEADTEINIADLINEIADSVQSEIETTKTEVLANVESGDSKLNADILTLANDLGTNVDYLDKKIDTLTETNASEHAQINKDMAQIGTGKIYFSQDGVQKAVVLLRSKNDTYVDFNTYGIDLSVYLKKEDMYTKDDITAMIYHLEQVANGKTNTFAISLDTNPIFNSQENEVLVASNVDDLDVVFTQISGNEVLGADIREFGDIVLINNTDVPDRWLVKKDGNLYAYKLETRKIDLNDYYTKSQIEQYITDYVAQNSKIKKVYFNGVEQEVSADGALNIVLDTQEVTAIDIDATPTQNSVNLITSGGVYNAISGKTGDLTTLQTTDKSSLVNAINEVKSSAGGGLELIWSGSAEVSLDGGNNINFPNSNYSAGGLFLIEYSSVAKSEFKSAFFVRFGETSTYSYRYTPIMFLDNSNRPIISSIKINFKWNSFQEMILFNNYILNTDGTITVIDSSSSSEMKISITNIYKVGD